jgi:hypothetical protein
MRRSELDDFLRTPGWRARLRKSPTGSGGGSVIAIGVGASTAIFGVVDPLLFRSLPYPNGHQLVSIGYFGPMDSSKFNVVSGYLDWRRQQAVFRELTAMRPGSQCDLLAGATPFRVTCCR